eukprot:TRINITY_DN68121_c5_g2_i1.p2 TRINITY_DN68121_c5_g2~~TRINITY_DN68121_c5_g2_i1.p2  ORF type:complete len:400 (-),score=53.88 TRINITY_DN68121_c5_g2_i1:2509-3708(-)
MSGVVAITIGIVTGIICSRKQKLLQKRIDGVAFFQHALQSQGKFYVDIGGTLSKIVYITPPGASGVLTEVTRVGKTGERLEALEVPWAGPDGGNIHFVKFGTHRVEPLVRQVLSRLSKAQARGTAPPDTKLPKQVFATGGGAFKYERLLKELHVEFNKVDEMQSLVDGLRFICSEKYGPKQEVFYYPSPDAERTYVDSKQLFPCLVVNIGSGVSVLKIEADGSYKRCGGTSQGGATFLGLCRLVSDANTFEEAMNLCAQGDNTQVDKLVGDIYGGSYTNLGLSSSVVASSLGKLAVMDSPKQCNRADVCLSILRMITQQIALLGINIARQHECADRIVFVGGFLRYNRIARRRIVQATNFIGGRALFLRHADFLGALGALASSPYVEEAALLGTRSAEG